MFHKPIRIGMVGYGAIGRVHALAYRMLPFTYGFPSQQVQVVGVATRQMVSARAAAEEIDCPFFTDDYRQLLARPDIDVIDCCAPNFLHEEIVLAAAAAGKAVYCEKPLAMNPAQAKRMVAAVESAGVAHQVTFHFRFIPAVLTAKRLMESSFVGRVFSFRGRYHRSGYISPAKPHAWRLSREMAGGGALFDLGSHIIDLLQWLLGDFASVQASLQTLIPERPRTAGVSETRPVDVDDLALLHVKRADGVLGTLEVSRMGTGATNDLQFEIFGELGALRFRADDPHSLEVYDARLPEPERGWRRLETGQRYAGQKAPDWTVTLGFTRMHAECQFQFLRALDAGQPPAPSFHEALSVQKVMAAAEASSASGAWVAV